MICDCKVLKTNEMLNQDAYTKDAQSMQAPSVVYMTQLNVIP